MCVCLCIGDCMYLVVLFLSVFCLWLFVCVLCMCGCVWMHTLNCSFGLIKRLTVLNYISGTCHFEVILTMVSLYPYHYLVRCSPGSLLMCLGFIATLRLM